MKQTSFMQVNITRVSKKRQGRLLVQECLEI